MNTVQVEKKYTEDSKDTEEYFDPLEDIFDTESPKWFEKLLYHVINLTKEELPALYTVTISTEPVELLGYPKMYWIIGLGKDTKLDWINDKADSALKDLKEPIMKSFPEIKLHEDLGLLICSDFTYLTTIEQIGFSKFYEIKLPDCKKSIYNLI